MGNTPIQNSDLAPAHQPVELTLEERIRRGMELIHNGEKPVRAAEIVGVAYQSLVGELTKERRAKGELPPYKSRTAANNDGVKKRAAAAQSTTLKPKQLVGDIGEYNIDWANGMIAITTKDSLHLFDVSAFIAELREVESLISGSV